ncbi:AMP-binding protein [Acuticoccus sp. M5D2P5]|uniref:AMP-binding protein n=1 Tax=Acuticoccus kalidii TaxID=2910977 RepID=UPI001F16C74F|nr:AMP-binding protein [Acuticoccus kalidii]MCF3933085.1 AMP-binding protein [Acuticoccus kalidii]
MTADIVREATSAPFAATVAAVLADAEAREGARTILVADGRKISVAALAAEARAVAADLAAMGIAPGDPVITMLGNGPNHVALFLGIALAGALWVPLNPEARGPSLAHSLATARPVLAFAAEQAAAALTEAGYEGRTEIADGWTGPARAAPQVAPHSAASPDDVRAILFTSGTTGPPKGVMVTERMLLASAAGTQIASDCEAGDVFLMWEPLHHIGGSQLVVMALLHGAKLVMVPRFSASRFWGDVRAHGVTKLHYLGGILEILLKAAPKADDREHPVHIAFGGGCRSEVWRTFEARFAIPIREVYGMTEASSFTTINRNGTVGSVGTPLPWFEVTLRDEAGAPVAPKEAGEFTVTASHPGLLTPGYLGAPEATGRLLRDGRLHTGDLGRRDAAGNYFFIGRVTDSLRRRGENVSAWEVETALVAHPDIAESAVVGVPASIGEHDILCFVMLAEGARFDAEALTAWCRTAMPPHHVPRYWKSVEDFARTPSQRIRRDQLDRSLDGAVDTAPARDR